MVFIIFLIVFLFLFNHYAETGLYITLYSLIYKHFCYGSVRAEKHFPAGYEKGRTMGGQNL